MNREKKRFPSVKDEWDGFARIVFRGMRPSAVQVNETKKAFYAGCVSMRAVIDRIGEPGVSEDESIAWLESIRKELLTFQRDILADHARKN